jgi:hypothetical protein
MSNQPRTIADLDADREVWIADSSRNRSRAHLDADCPKVRNGSEPRTRRVLHPSLQICKCCDPAYEFPRELRKQDGDE